MKTSTSLPSPFDDGKLYDLLFAGFDYGLEFYSRLAAEAKGPILDVACGTGRVMLPLLQAGHDVDGLDLFEGMLGTLREKAAAAGFAPKLYRSDMRQFDLERCYALIVIPFNAVVHNLTQADQISCLASCHRHLLPGGVLAFDTFFPSWQVIGASSGERVLELETTHAASGNPMRIFDTRAFDRVEQIQRSLIEIEILSPSGEVESVHRSETRLRWIYKSEMSLLLETAGFRQYQIGGDFDMRPLTDENQIMAVTAHRDGVERV